MSVTQAGQLQDGEFEFEKPVGQGGAGRASDMPSGELRRGISLLEGEFAPGDIVGVDAAEGELRFSKLAAPAAAEPAAAV